MPLGQLIPNPQLKKRYSYRNDNEYIVYDESQVALRYLVQFRRYIFSFYTGFSDISLSSKQKHEFVFVLFCSMLFRLEFFAFQRSLCVYVFFLMTYQFCV
jgi:hypothetical protein